MSAMSAPESVKFCSRCGAAMEARPVEDKLRRVCPACGFVHFTDPKVGVGVMVVQAGRLLLVRRTMDPERGKWSIPAGFVDAGEDPAETAVREAFEETNLQVAIDGVVDVYHNPPAQGGASIFILYQARLLGGQAQIVGDDADAVGFFGLEELPEIAFASTRDAIQRLARKPDN